MTRTAIDWDSPFWSKVHPEALSGCWLWHGSLDTGGYASFNVKCGYGVRRTVRGSRYVFELLYGEWPAGRCVLHKCDVRSCVNPDHLFLGDHRDNNHDKMRKGRQPMKLSRSDVAAIRERASAGEIHARIAEEFRVNRRCVDRVVSGERRSVW